MYTITEPTITDGTNTYRIGDIVSVETKGFTVVGKISKIQFLDPESGIIIDSSASYESKTDYINLDEIVSMSKVVV